MNFKNNPNLESPEKLIREYANFNLKTGKFGGKPSHEDQYSGVPLMFDRENARLILDGTDTHTLVFGSSGSKKTRAVVLPTIHMLCQAGESMVIHDAKGELYRRTATFLKKCEYDVIAVNLRKPEVGYAWNPLTIPYRYYKMGDIDKAAEFANDVASTITLGEISSSKDPFWERSAHDCAFGLMLLLFRYCKENDLPDSAVNMANLAALRRALFKNDTRSQNSWLWKWGSTDELIASSLSGTVMTAEETMKGILSVLDQKLRTFTINGTLMDMLANSNFEIDSIGQKKTAVFLITPDEKTSFHSLVAIFVSQSYQRLIYTAETTGGRVPLRINYILDEFSSLPAIGNDFPSMITAARSRNIRFLIVAQSKNQLIHRYREEANTIMGNCTNWIIMFTRELGLLNEVSELCGKQRNGLPNISVFDLQHLSKERNQVLLLAGRLKPAVVELIDISKLDGERYHELDFCTPERAERCKLDFQSPPAIIAQELSAKIPKNLEIQKVESDSNPIQYVGRIRPKDFTFNPTESTIMSENNDDSNSSWLDFDKFFLNEQEQYENKKPNKEIEELISKIEQRRNELKDADAPISEK